MRFATALEGCLVALLDALFTLIVFTPILTELSREVAPPFEMGAVGGVWLWGMAFTCSLVGLTGAVRTDAASPKLPRLGELARRVSGPGVPPSGGGGLRKPSTSCLSTASTMTWSILLASMRRMNEANSSTVTVLSPLMSTTPQTDRSSFIDISNFEMSSSL